MHIQLWVAKRDYRHNPRVCVRLCVQEKLGRGEFARSSNLRVLHLRMNPEAEFHKQVRT